MPATIASPLVKATRICGARLDSVVEASGWACGASSEETADVLATKARIKAATNLKMPKPALWKGTLARANLPQLCEQCITFRSGNEQE